MFFLLITNKKNKLEVLFASLTIVMSIFIFNVFFPIFIDRSISYHIVMSASKPDFSINNIEYSQYTKNMYKDRIKELEKLGLINNNGGIITQTKFGKIFSAVIYITSKISNKEIKKIDSTDTSRIIANEKDNKQ